VEFEKRLLVTSRNFFRNLQQNLLGNLTLSDFLAKADKQLEEEAGRLSKYLTWPGIDQHLISEFQREVLMNNQAELFETANGTLNFEQPRGLLSLFVLSKEADLKLLFKLYRPIKEGLKPIADLYKAYLVRQGQSYVESCETH
jgi:cullin 1